MSVVPWSTTRLVATEAMGQVLRGSGGPHSRPSQPGLAQTCGHVHVEEQLPSTGRGWSRGVTASLLAVSVWPGPHFLDEPHTSFPWGQSDHQGLSGVGSGQAPGLDACGWAAVL